MPCFDELPPPLRLPSGASVRRRAKACPLSVSYKGNGSIEGNEKDTLGTRLVLLESLVRRVAKDGSKDEIIPSRISFNEIISLVRS